MYIYIYIYIYMYVYIYYCCRKSPNSNDLCGNGFMDVFKTPIVRQSKMTSCTKQVSNRKAALFLEFNSGHMNNTCCGVSLTAIWHNLQLVPPMLFCRPRGCPPGYTTVILISSFPHTLHEKIFRRNINIYLQLFILFLHNIMSQIVEILSWCKTRNYLFYIVNIMEPGHQKPWYWPS